MLGNTEEVILLYGAAGRLLLSPDDETDAGVASGELPRVVLAAARGLTGCAEAVVGAAEKVVRAAREEIGGRSSGSLREAYARVFGHALSPDYPPYETQYGDDPVFRQPQRLANVRGFYRAFGVEVPRQAHERADHFGVEMEFLALLTAREATAVAAGDRDPAKVCANALEKFLREHLGPALSTFRRLLEDHVKKAFYPAVATLAEEVCAWDCGRRGVAVAVDNRARLVSVLEPELNAAVRKVE